MGVFNYVYAILMDEFEWHHEALVVFLGVSTQTGAHIRKTYPQ